MNTHLWLVCALLFTGCHQGVPIEDQPPGVPTLAGDALCTSTTGSWSTMLVDEPGTHRSDLGLLGASTSLAASASGVAAIAYNNVAQINELRLATRTDALTWSVQTFPDFGRDADDGLYSVVRFDSAGRPVVAIADRSTAPAGVDVRLGDGTALHVDATGSSIYNVVMVLDGADHPHLAYGRADTGLTYAGWDGAAWQIEPLHPGTVVDASIAVDADGRPSVAFTADSRIVLARRGDDGTWSFETVAESPPPTVFLHSPSLAIDSGGRPHLTFIDDQTKTLKYAIRSDTIWQLESLGCAHDAGSAALALDAADRPHVAFAAPVLRLVDGRFVSATAALQYAARDDRRWSIEPVDSTPLSADLSPSIAVARDGVARVSWCDLTSGTVQYGERR